MEHAQRYELSCYHLCMKQNDQSHKQGSPRTEEQMAPAKEAMERGVEHNLEVGICRFICNIKLLLCTIVT